MLTIRRYIDQHKIYRIYCSLILAIIAVENDIFLR